MRTQVFEKTKMCKFHILGACTKGSSCRFAHSQSELQCLPDLACTKLCKTLIATGGCDNPDCRYAHSQEELRPLPFPDVETEKEMRHFELPLAAGEVRPGVRRSSSALSMSALQKDKAYQTFMQIGQAAQAHAAEARRLHAAAAEIQAAHLADDAPYYMNQTGLDTMSMHGQEDLQAELPERFLPLDLGQLLGVQGSLGPQPKPLRSVASAAGRLCSLAGQDTEEMQPEVVPLAPLSRPRADEPVQINLHSLRSLSGNNLVGMAEDTDNDGLGLPAESRPWMHSRNPSRDLVSFQESPAPVGMPRMVPSQVIPGPTKINIPKDVDVTSVEEFWHRREGPRGVSDIFSLEQLVQDHAVTSVS